MPVQRVLSRFALMVETKGGAGAIAAYNALLNTTFADGNLTQIERNPPPVTGAAHISGPGNTITPFKSAGATTAPEQARRLLLMVAAAEGLPETFFGDASTGSLATAVSLDRPTELKFREIQQRWTDIITSILIYVLWVTRRTPGSTLREAKTSAPVKPHQLIVKFPAVLEHDIQKMVQAITEVATLGARNGTMAGIVDRRTAADLMLAEVGLENRTKLLDVIFPQGEYDAHEDVQEQIKAAAVPPPMPGQPLNAKVKPNAPKPKA